jgi:hypothetical protein
MCAMVADPFARLLFQREREHAELERLLEAVGQAALAETFAGLWRHTLGERTVVLAAGTPPNGNGLEQAAQRLWVAALNRWIKPVADSVWRTQHTDASATAKDQLWDKISARIKWTIELVVEAITATLTANSRQSPDYQRTLVAELLSLDSFTLSLWEQIHAIEADLLDPNRGRVDTDAIYARRVRMQANAFLLNASRARSKGFAALAVAEPDKAADYRRLAREANRPATDVNRAARDLDRFDEKLFHNPDLEAEQLATLRAKLDKIVGEGRHGHETWRNSITRDARAIATGLLNASTLRYGLDQQHATGQPWIKQWHSTHDERVRPTHKAADEQVRAIALPFDVGDAPLDHPADFDAPPQEFYGCRCGMFVMSKAQHDELIANFVPFDALAAASTQEDLMTVAADEELADLPPVMWHGVISQEDTYTGDRRFWYPGAMRTQAMPLPIRFQREDWGGHTGAVVVANADAVRRFDNNIRAWGTFADGTLTPEVEEVIGLMATRMIRGVSIDGDDVLDSQFTLELDAEGNVYEKYNSIRLRGSTFCAIPAFDGAEVYLGPPPPEWLLEGEPVSVEQNVPGETRPLDQISDTELEAMLAASRIPENLAQYWTLGEGAAKIRWGTEGDFERCRRNLAQYIGPGQLSGACANLHHRALGVWPGREAAALKTPYLMAGALLSEDTRANEAPGLQEHDLTTDADWVMTRDQFMPRELGELTAVTIDDDGNVYGHLAGWASCHAGFSDMCVTPPHSKTGYSLFHTGAVRLSTGEDLPVGKLTVGSGHASPTGLGVRGAVAHYDNSAVAVAVVRATEDKWGIQVAGRIIPGTPRERVEELRRSPISGDWRTYQGNLELIAGLGVNSPGFPVPRAMVASVEGRQLSLVAAGYVAPDNSKMIEELAARIAPTPAEIDRRVAKLATRMATINGGQ